MSHSFTTLSPIAKHMRKVLPQLLLCVGLLSCKQESVVHPERKDIIEAVYASGSIIPKDEYMVNSLVLGTVVEKRVTEGDSVGAGTILYVLRNTSPTDRYAAAQQAYQNAQANLSENSPIIAELKIAAQNAESKFRVDSLELNRYKKLRAEGAITASQFDAISNGYTISDNMRRSAQERLRLTLQDLRVARANAKSMMSAAGNDLDNYSIKSDGNGFVFQLFKEVGDAVRLGEQVALLGAKSERTIRLAVDQQDIEKVKVGQEVLVRTDVTGADIHKATISKIYPVMNPADQTFRVDAVFTDTIPTQFVHSSVEGNIIIKEKKNALIIPRSALLQGDSVKVKIDGEEKTVHVTTGIMSIDRVEILSGIDEKAEIIEPTIKK
ncbi:MAG TPA: HlyD family efflux transporter periplasmic adaptor subunit [Candidatus Kapabacteria bacterium]